MLSDLLHTPSLMQWDEEGRDWPNREYSRFVDGFDGGRTHVQVMGNGPPLLLIHGAGASSHSFRDLGPRLARWATVIVPDLPGHAFSRPGRSGDLSIMGMVRSVSSMLRSLKQVPVYAVGHSAGAAILCSLIAEGALSLRGWMGINPALEPLRGLAKWVLPSMARLSIRKDLGPKLVAWSTERDPQWVARTVRGTGSHLDRRGLELYRLLAQSPGHVAGTMAMMASWDLSGLQDRLQYVDLPTHIVLGDRDRAVSPYQTERLIRKAFQRAAVTRLAGLGHLAHEERPDHFAALIERQVLQLKPALGRHA